MHSEVSPPSRSSPFRSSDRKVARKSRAGESGARKLPRAPHTELHVNSGIDAEDSTTAPATPAVSVLSLLCRFPGSHVFSRSRDEETCRTREASERAAAAISQVFPRSPLPRPSVFTTERGTRSTSSRFPGRIIPSFLPAAAREIAGNARSLSSSRYLMVPVKSPITQLPRLVRARAPDTRTRTRIHHHRRRRGALVYRGHKGTVV